MLIDKGRGVMMSWTDRQTDFDDGKQTTAPPEYARGMDAAYAGEDAAAWGKCSDPTNQGLPRENQHKAPTTGGPEELLQTERRPSVDCG